MIATEKRTVICFTLAISFFSHFYSGVVGVIFLQEIVDDIESELSEQSESDDWKRHIFNILGVDGRRSYCRLTCNVFPDDNLRLRDMGHITYSPKIYKYRNTYIIECNTLPIVFLRYERYEKQPELAVKMNNFHFIIMIEKNEYMNESRKFHFDEIESDPVMCPKKTDSLEGVGTSAGTSEKFGKTLKLESEEETIETSPLTKLSRFQRLHLCMAVRDRRNADKPLIFLDNKVEEAQLYEISYPHGEAETPRITLKCPTKPPMYVYYRDLQVNDDDLQVIIVEKKEDIRQV